MRHSETEVVTANSTKRRLGFALQDEKDGYEISYDEEGETRPSSPVSPMEVAGSKSGSSYSSFRITFGEKNVQEEEDFKLSKNGLSAKEQREKRSLLVALLISLATS